MDFNNEIIENAAENAEQQSGGSLFKYVAIFTAGVIAGVAGEKLVHHRAKKRAAKKAAKRAAERLAEAAAQEVDTTFDEVDISDSEE